MEGKKLGAPERIHGFESTARAPPNLSLSVPVGKAMFRILCFVTRAGSVIGTDRIVIKQLKESTKSSIFVETDPSDSRYCVIRIIADVGSPSWVKLGEEEEEEVEVSRAQNALIRVFEVVNVFNTSGKVSWSLLIEASYVGALIGYEGGDLIERIRKETGSIVDIFQDDLPRCAKPGDVMVKIEGNISAVKKALISISTRLQACQSTDGDFQAALHKLNEVVPRGEASYRSRRQYREVGPRDSLHRHVEISQENAACQITQDSLSRHTSDHSLSASAPEYHPVTTKKHSLIVVMKILCSNERASCVIGQEDAIKSETGVFISVGDTFADCYERLIKLSQINIQDRNSPLTEEKKQERISQAQRAIVLVFSRLYETATENDNITARLVVPSNQIGRLLGKGSHRIHEMKERSGAFIQVLKAKQNPKCVAGNNQVVQISGKLSNVKEAINHVTRRLVENMRYYSIDVTSRPVDAHTGPRPHTGPRGVYDGAGRGLPSTKDDHGIIDRNKSSNVTNTSVVDISIPENAVNFVCGYGENCYDHVEGLRQMDMMTGAKVILHEPRLGARDRITTIYGTPDQTEEAEKLLRSFISYGESISLLKR